MFEALQSRRRACLSARVPNATQACRTGVLLFYLFSFYSSCFIFFTSSAPSPSSSQDFYHQTWFLFNFPSFGLKTGTAEEVTSNLTIDILAKQMPCPAFYVFQSNDPTAGTLREPKLVVEHAHKAGLLSTSPTSVHPSIGSALHPHPSIRSGMSFSPLACGGTKRSLPRSPPLS